MTEEELVVEEEKIPALAVEALENAQRAARASGFPLVLVEDGMLVRVTGDERVELGTVAPKYRATSRKIWAQT